jgi:hypothetical protein
MAEFLIHLYFGKNEEEFYFMKLSLLLWNFYYLSLQQYSVTLAYLISMKLGWSQWEFHDMVLNELTWHGIDEERHGMTLNELTWHRIDEERDDKVSWDEFYGDESYNAPGPAHGLGPLYRGVSPTYVATRLCFRSRFTQNG